MTGSKSNSCSPLSSFAEELALLEELDDEVVNTLAQQIASKKYMVPEYIASALGNPTPKAIEAPVWALHLDESYFAEDFAKASTAWALGKLEVASPEVLRGLEWLRDNGH